MAMDIRHLGERLDPVLNQMSGLSSNIAVIVIGSISQGFGTSSSDIDVVVVDPAAPQTAGDPFRLLTHVGEQRCEIYVMPPDKLHSIGAEFAGKAGGVDYNETFEFYHRVCFGSVIRGRELANEARRLFRPEHASALLSDYHRQQCAQRAQAAVALHIAGVSRVAAGMARKALVHFLRQKLGEAGFSYATRSEKFLFEQLHHLNRGQRLSEAEHLVQQFRPRDPGAYVQRACEQMNVDATSVRAHCRAREGVELRAILGATVFAVSDRTVMVSESQEQLARDLMSGELGELSSLSPNELDAVRALFEAGVAVLTINDGAQITCDYPSRLRTLLEEPLLSYKGFRPVDGGRPLRDASIGLTDVARAGFEVGRSAVFYGNDVEDAVGAIRDRRWWDVDCAFRSMLRWAATGYLASRGVACSSDDWLWGMIQRTPSLAVLRAAVDAAPGSAVSNPRDALAFLNTIEAAVALLPDGTWDWVTESMADGEKFKRMKFEVMEPWGRLLMGATNTHLRKPGLETLNPASGFADAQSRMSMNWSRRDDVRTELIALG